MPAHTECASSTIQTVRRREHSRLSTALEMLRSADLSAACSSRSPVLLRRGVAEFNRRQFFEQHETLEELWRSEPAPIRYLYQGILQLGVGFYHLERANFHGAVVKLENGLALLDAFGPVCMCIDVARLCREAAACLQAVLTLGPNHLPQFDWSTVPTIRWKRGRRQQLGLDPRAPTGAAPLG